jgi:hypothetical protein
MTPTSVLFRNRAYGDMLPISAQFAIPGRSCEDVLRLAAEHGQFADAGETPAEREAWLGRVLAAHRSPGEPRTVRLAGGR